MLAPVRAVDQTRKEACGHPICADGVVPAGRPRGDPVTVTWTTDEVSTAGKDGKNHVEVANVTAGTSDTFTITVAAERAVVA